MSKKSSQVMKRLMAFMLVLLMTCSSMAITAVAEEPAPSAGTNEGCPHSHAEDAQHTVIKEATCEEDGQYNWICVTCKQTYSEIVHAKGHTKDSKMPVDYDEETCTEKGAKWYHCSVCNKDFFEEIPATGHAYQIVTSHEATCTSPATQDVKCSVCGDETTIVVEGSTALGHVWSDKASNQQWKELAGIDVETVTPKKTHTKVVPASCAEDGYVYEAYYCLRCGAYSDEAANTVETIEAIEHDFATECGVTWQVDASGNIVYDENGNKIVKKVTYKENKSFEAHTDENGNKIGAVDYEYAAPTCTEDGCIYAVCRLCGASESGVLKATGHDWKQTGEVEFKSCLENGVEVYKCDDCGVTKQEVLKARGYHTYDKNCITYYQQKFFDNVPTGYSVKKIAPCLAYTTVTKCDLCEETKTEEHAATTEEHAEGATIYFQASTCTKNGYIIYQCKDCEYPIRKDLEMAEHDWKEVVTTPATCGESGLLTRTCTVCGAVETEEIPTMGHTKIIIEQNEGSCTKQASYKEYCAACGEVLVEEYYGYKHVSEGATIIAKKDATCKEAGLISYYCAKPECHAKVVDEEIAPLDHKYENGKSAVTKIDKEYKEATCTEAGVITYQCKLCKDKWTEEDPNAPAKGHADCNLKAQVKAGTAVVEVRPTCTETGIAYYQCSECGETLVYEIPALGHNWKVTYNEENGVYESVCCDGGKDELGNSRKGCGAVEDIELEAPEYEISLNGKKGTIALKSDEMERLPVAYIRVSYGYQLEDGSCYAVVTCVAVNFEEDGTGTFRIPNVQGTGTMTGMNLMVVTNADADDLRYAAAVSDSYGETTID